MKRRAKTGASDVELGSAAGDHPDLIGWLLSSGSLSEMGIRGGGFGFRGAGGCEIEWSHKTKDQADQLGLPADLCFLENAFQLIPHRILREISARGILVGRQALEQAAEQLGFCARQIEEIAEHLIGNAACSRFRDHHGCDRSAWQIRTGRIITSLCQGRDPGAKKRSIRVGSHGNRSGSSFRGLLIKRLDDLDQLSVGGLLRDAQTSGIVDVKSVFPTNDLFASAIGKDRSSGMVQEDHAKAEPVKYGIQKGPI